MAHPSIDLADQMLVEALEAGTLVKVAPWGTGQGDYVIIAAADFDPKVHKKIGGAPPLKGMNKAALLAQAEAEGVAVEDGATNKQIAAAIEAARKAAQ